MMSQIFEPYCDSDKQTPLCIIFIRMLYGKVVLANALMQFLLIFLQENQTPGPMLKGKLNIILGISQTLGKLQRID